MRRILPHLILLTIIAATVALGAAPQASTRPSAPPATWNSYSLILSRNIFTRDRKSRTRDSSPRVRNFGSELILTGVAEQGPEQIAFFEDSVTGDITRAAIGQRIGGSTVTAIRLDGVDITTGNSKRTIAVGDTLSGRQVDAESPSYPTAATPPTAASSQPAGEGGEGGIDETTNSASRPSEEPPAGGRAPMTLEEQMRQRRLQETR